VTALVPMLVIVTVRGPGCVYGASNEPNDRSGFALIIQVGSAVTVKRAMTDAIAPPVPLTLITSSQVPTSSPGFGRMVNSAVAPFPGRTVVERSPVSYLVETGCSKITGPVPVLVIVTVRASGCAYPSTNEPNDRRPGNAFIM